MRALERPEARLRKAKRFAWLLAVVISFPLSYVLVILRAPGAPWWLGLVCGAFAFPVIGLLMSRALTASTSDLLYARLGTVEERRRRLAEPPTRYASSMTRAALALEAGKLAEAAALLGSIRPIDRRQPLFFLVSQRNLLVTGDPTTKARALEALLAWRQLLRLGLHTEMARYHAFLIAEALADRAHHDPQVVDAVKRFRADSDFEVRAYATWLSNEGSGDELLAGAALARAAGREPLAQSLELRAARLAAGDRVPYRDAP